MVDSEQPNIFTLSKKFTITKFDCAFFYSRMPKNKFNQRKQLGGYQIDIHMTHEEPAAQKPPKISLLLAK